MKKPTIAIDIDDVLAYSAKAIIEYSNRHYGTSLAVDDYSEHLMELWGVDLKEAEHRLEELHRSSDTISNFEHNPDAIGVLAKLKQDYDLLIVTSRRLMSKDVTLSWVKTKFAGVFDENDIHFAGIWDKVDSHTVHRTKGEKLKSLCVDYLIDDQLKHCSAAAVAGIDALLFGNYKWNQVDKLPSGVHRVADWAEVEEYFNGRV